MTKRLLTLLTAVLVALPLFVSAQTSFNKHAVTFKLLGVDYTSPYQDEFTETFDFFNRHTYGGEIQYSKYLSKSFNIGIPFRMANIDYPTSDSSRVLNSLQAGVDIVAQYKFANGYIIKREDPRLAPYIVAGVGATYADLYRNDDDPSIGDNFDVQIPVGLGLNFKLGKQVYAQAQSEYRISALQGNNNFVHSAGLVLQLGEGAPDPEPVEPPAPSDRDGDGIIDADDKCPDTPGLAKYEGCPDTDEDGIIDSEDDCPEVAGLADFNGCPDTDGDGITDAKDKCPNKPGVVANDGCPEETKDRDGDGIEDSKDDCPDTPGTARFNGCADTDGDGIADPKDNCPTVAGTTRFNGCPDTDGDGIADSADKCPTVAGTAKYEGCPPPKITEEDKQTLEFATQAIEFETGSATIRTRSYSVLDQVASILLKYPDYNVSIDGFTDSVGGAASNKSLSERRAKACYEYLKGKGVASNRMSYMGYGEERPIASNDTKEGRQRNRRVEFNVYLSRR